MTASVKTAKRSKTEYRRMTSDELADMHAMLHSLDDHQWDEPSLCEGWKVRHVIGHLCLGARTNPLKLPILAAPYGFNIAKTSGRESFRYGEEHTPAEALILAMSGRPVSLPELDGDGVDVLRSRLTA